MNSKQHFKIHQMRPQLGVFLFRREVPGGLRGRQTKHVACYSVLLCFAGLCFTFALLRVALKHIDFLKQCACSEIGLSSVFESVEVERAQALLLAVALLSEGEKCHALRFALLRCLHCFSLFCWWKWETRLVLRFVCALLSIHCCALLCFRDGEMCRL